MDRWAPKQKEFSKLQKPSKQNYSELVAYIPEPNEIKKSPLPSTNPSLKSPNAYNNLESPQELFESEIFFKNPYKFYSNN